MFPSSFYSQATSLIPSLKLTWPLKMDGWKMKFPFGCRPRFRGYISFREGNHIQPKKKNRRPIPFFETKLRCFCAEKTEASPGWSWDKKWKVVPPATPVRTTRETCLLAAGESLIFGLMSCGWIFGVQKIKRGTMSICTRGLGGDVGG